MIYLDHHATTPVDARVLEAMLPFFTEKFGNAASKQHRFGWDANDAVERGAEAGRGADRRGQQGHRLHERRDRGQQPRDQGAARAAERTGRRRQSGDHIVTVATEHKAVLDPIARLEKDGWRVTVLPVGRDGLVDVAAVDASITERTALVSVMAANNEIGVLQPIKELAAAAHAKGAWFHTDAVQAAGKVPFDVDALDVDFASITAHKIYGPKGVGALYVRVAKGRIAE